MQKNDSSQNKPRSITTTINNSEILPLFTLVDSEIFQTPYSNYELPFSNLLVILITKISTLNSTCATDEKHINKNKEYTISLEAIFL